MSATTGIEWCNSTFNPWRGCTKVSPGCRNCYAETFSGRNPGTLGVWGPQGTRVVAAESAWREPVKWNKAAACDCHRRTDLGEKHLPSCPQAARPRVFCASLADVFEDWQGPMVTSGGLQLWRRTVPVEPAPGVTGELYGRRWTTSDHYPDTVALTMGDVRARLFEMIDDTPHLDWLLLTKRPENIGRMMPRFRIERRTDESNPARPNVWLGTSVEDQPRADERIPHLLKVPAAVRFLSCEPLLGPVDLTRLTYRGDRLNPLDTANDMAAPHINWVIVGGESGGQARPCSIGWVRNLVAQCKAAGVPVFVKQLGARPEEWNPDRPRLLGRIPLTDRKGGDVSEWPEDLRVREFPGPGR